MKRKKCQVRCRKELVYYVTWGSNITHNVHWCVTVDYQQIANGNIANQIHGFTIDYGKFILNILIIQLSYTLRVLILWLADLYHVILGCNETTTLSSLLRCNSRGVNSTRHCHYTMASVDSKFNDFFFGSVFNLNNKNVKALIARELLGFTSTRPLTMNLKFSIPHEATECGIEISGSLLVNSCR